MMLHNLFARRWVIEFQTEIGAPWEQQRYRNAQKLLDLNPLPGDDNESR
jgi:hypothetical protein